MPPGSGVFNGFLVPWGLVIVATVLVLLSRMAARTSSKVEGPAQELLQKVERERRSMSILGSFRWLMRLSLLAEGAEEGWQLGFILLGVTLMSLSVAGLVVMLVVGMISVFRLLALLGIILLVLLLLVPVRAHLLERQKAWATLFCALLSMHLRLFFDLRETYVTRDLTDSLTSLDGPTYARTFRQDTALVLVSALCYFSMMYSTNHWCLHMREQLTNRLLDAYLAHRRYYVLDLISGEVDNPDQRIQDDMFQFSVMLQYVTIASVDAIFRTLLFGGVVATIDLSLLVGLVAFIIFFMTLFVALTRTYTNTNALQQAFEADFRYSLVHLRDHGEAVAYYHGEAHERKVFDAKFGAAANNYQLLMLLAACVQTFFVAYGPQATTIASYITGNLRIMHGADMGIIAESSAAFNNIIISAAFPVMLCGDISKSFACVLRVAHLLENLIKKREPPEIVSVLHEGGSEAKKLELRAVEVQTPNKMRTLVRNLSISFTEEAQGQFSVLIVGPSGVGKSSLMRVLLGLWTHGQGQVHRPPEHECVFLPQKPYMPQGSLRNQLLYPENEGDEAVLRELLALFALAELPSRFQGGFEAVRPWAKVLSLGEQQRVALVRCLRLQRRVAMLDEATSALPWDMEAALYDELRRRKVCYVSVGHRQSLLDYHKQVLKLGADGTWQILTTEEYKRQIRI